jgi:hypothetical protein
MRRWLVWALVAGCMVTAALAQSNRPAPSLPKTESQQPPSHAGTAQQPPSSDERGTEQSPLIVKAIPAPKTEAEAAEEKAERDDVSAANWWMVRFTGIIGLIGLLQLFVFGWQGWHLRSTVRTMRTIAAQQREDTQASIEATRRAADAAAESAQAAIRQLEQLDVSLAISREAADATRTAADAATRSAQAAIGVELPFLHIVEMRLSSDPPQDLGELSAWSRQFTPFVKFKNYGRTPAFITEVIINVKLGIGAMPIEVVYMQNNPYPNLIVLEGGAEYEYAEWLFRADKTFTVAEINQLNVVDAQIMLYGVIRFKDFLGTGHDRGFIYAWHRDLASGCRPRGAIYPRYDYQT